MAGTALNFNSNKTHIGPGTIWIVPVPAASARLALDATTGTPDSTLAPGSVHLGQTTGGSVFNAKATTTDFFADEFQDPIRSQVTAAETSITCELEQTADLSMLINLLPGVGTRVTGTGYDSVTLGSIPLTYISVAVITPSVADATKFEVYHLYKVSNTTGVSINTSRKALGKTAVTFKGLAITSRATTDTTGNIWTSV